MSNPFTADLGTYQGRILSSSAIQGSYVYELGHALRGRIYPFHAEDHHTTSQVNVDLTGIASLRYTVITRGATTMPIGARWTFRLLVDGTTYLERELDARVLTLRDLTVNLHGAGLTGNHTIAAELGIKGVGSGVLAAELPGCALDALVTDDAGQALEVCNRIPEPNELVVPVGGPFYFDVESSAGSADPDLARTTVYLDGEAIFDGSTFTDGWTGSSVGTTLSDGQRFTLFPDLPIAPSATHVLRVVSAVVGGPAGALDTSWTFSTVDTVSPVVTEALATREREIRLVFSETVVQGDGTGSGDALNPANYALTVEAGAPAVTPLVTAVTSDGAGRVFLTLDRTMTRRATYRVTVTGVTDLMGNEVGDPTNAVTFEGFSTPGPAARSFDLYQLWVTANCKAQDAQEGNGDLQTLFSILQEPIDLLLGVIDRMQDVYDPDLAPEAFVDLMLLRMGNPFTFPLSEIEKRKLVQILVPIYQSKGTGPGIVDAVRLFLGIEVELNVYAWSPVGLGEAIMNENFILGSSDPDDLLTFQVLVPRVLTSEEKRKMSQIIDYMMVAEELFVIIEPQEVVTPDHWQMGFSLLNYQTFLHSA